MRSRACSALALSRELEKDLRSGEGEVTATPKTVYKRVVTLRHGPGPLRGNGCEVVLGLFSLWIGVSNPGDGLTYAVRVRRIVSGLNG